MTRTVTRSSLCRRTSGSRASNSFDTFSSDSSESHSSAPPPGPKRRSGPRCSPLVPLASSHIILFVYLFSLCSTAVYSCRTEDFVCMEMSAAALRGLSCLMPRSVAAKRRRDRKQGGGASKRAKFTVVIPRYARCCVQGLPLHLMCRPTEQEQGDVHVFHQPSQLTH